MKINYFFFAGVLALILNLESKSQTPCSGAPSSNTAIASSTMICSGTGVNLSLANAYTVTGVQYQWFSSTQSPVGPWASVSGATLSAYNVSAQTTSTVWYTAVLTCTNGNSTTTAVSTGVQVQSTVTSAVPYYEGFTGITNNDQLPNCFWFSPNLGTTAHTYTNGGKYAGFYYNPSGVSHMYTNGIQLYAGVVYSASVWYQANPNYSNWTDLSLLVGPNQSTTGLVSIVSTNGPAMAMSYTPLSNTFTVAVSGIYYIDVRGTGNNSQAGQYLLWDDLSITIPCSLNSPTLGISSSQNTVCSGEVLSLSVFGADTYTWGVGGNGSSIVTMPVAVVPTIVNYPVSGTNTLSGCTSTANQAVQIYPTPAISVISNTPYVCQGQPANLTAIGANSYTWNTGATNQNVITVSPLVTTAYSVMGSNIYGCNGIATQSIMVLALPNVNAVPSSNTLCAGGTITLTGTGATTYQWFSNSIFIQANPAIVSPSITTSYTLNGINANGCQNKTIINITVFDLPMVSIVSSNSHICKGETATLSISGNASTYNWIGFITTGSLVVNPTGSTTYTLEGISIEGCKSSATYNVQVDECVGLTEQGRVSKDTFVYPNPTNNAFIIATNSSSEKTIELSDVTGRNVIKLNFSDEKIILHVECLTAGIYYMKITSNDSSEIIKVVKQ
jgi:hypothetical protein